MSKNVESPVNKAQKVYWRIISDQLALATMPETEHEMTKALTLKRVELRKAQKAYGKRVEVSRDEWDDHVNLTLADLLRYRGQPTPTELEKDTRSERAAW